MNKVFFFQFKCTQEVQHRLPDVLGGVPPFRGQLATLRVIDRRMQDGDAYVSILEKAKMTSVRSIKKTKLTICRWRHKLFTS